MKRIGFIGLGIMGQAMSANILKAGYPLVVYNRNPLKTETLVQLGAEAVHTPAELVESTDIIIAMVTGPQALDEVLLGTTGAESSLNPEKILINMSSVSPIYTRALDDRIRPTGAVFIDAPVSGTKKPAEDGTLIILAGGPEEKVTEVEPILLTMGKKVIFCGPAGQGSMMKMFINLLLGLMTAGLAEALNFGRAGDLSYESMLDTVFSGSLDCPMYHAKAPLLIEKKYSTAFPLKHMTKDAKFISDMAYELNTPIPIGNTILQLYSIGVAQGWGDEDISAIGRVLEHLSPTKEDV